MSSEDYIRATSSMPGYNPYNKPKPKATIPGTSSPSAFGKTLSVLPGVASLLGKGKQAFDVLKTTPARPAPVQDLKPVAPGYAATYDPDVQYANAVNAAQRSISSQLAELEREKARRVQAAVSRYNLTGPTGDETSNLNAQLAGIESDYNASAQAITRNYGAATNEAKIQSEGAKKIAASASGDIKKYYDAAQAAVGAVNNEALAAASAGTDVGLGNTVVSGESNLAGDALLFDGLREGASAADEAAVRSNDLSYLAASIGEEQANQGSSISKARADNSGEARRIWNAQVAERIRAEREAAAQAQAEIESGISAQRASLLDQQRNLGLTSAQYEGGRRDNYLAGKGEYDTAQNISSYEDELASWKARQAKLATSDIGAKIRSKIKAGVVTGAPVDGGTIHKSFEGQVLSSGTDALNNVISQTEEAYKLPPEERNAAINAIWNQGGLSELDRAFLKKAGLTQSILRSLG